MTELEKVEKLREKANVGFAEAKEALDHVGGDILDALIYLEKQGKSTVPAGGGFFSGDGAPAPEQHYQRSDAGEPHVRVESFGDMMRRFGRFCLRLIDKGTTNFIEATKNGNLLFSCPVLAAVILILFFFWVTVPLFVLSLFFGFRYSFRGPDLGRDSFNRVMDSATDMADGVKRSFTDGHRNPEGPESEENQ